MATKTTPKKAPAKKATPTLADAAKRGQVKFYRQRRNGTYRHLPYYAPGTETRKAAELVAQRREQGDTVNKIADDLKASVATVRRLITGLELAQAVEAGEYAKGWKPEDTEVIIGTE